MPAHVQFLVNDRHADSLCLLGREIPVGFPEDLYGTSIPCVYAAEDFHQRGLACAVFAEQRHNLAGTQLKSDVVQRLHAGKTLADALHGNDNLVHPHVHPSFLVVLWMHYNSACLFLTRGRSFDFKGGFYRIVINGRPLFYKYCRISTKSTRQFSKFTHTVLCILRNCWRLTCRQSAKERAICADIQSKRMTATISRQRVTSSQPCIYPCPEKS